MLDQLHILAHIFFPQSILTTLSRSMQKNSPSPISPLLKHHRHELVEKPPRIVRPGRCLGVVLNREYRTIHQSKSAERSIVQMHMRRPRPDRLKRCRIDRKPMVLARDRHAPRLYIEHRLIRPAMSEPQLARLRPTRQCDQLVPKADPKGWNPQTHLRADDLAQHPDRRLDRSRIARTIGHKDPVNLPSLKSLAYLTRLDRVGHHLDDDPPLGEMTQNAVLRTAINRQHTQRAVA